MKRNVVVHRCNARPFGGGAREEKQIAHINECAKSASLRSCAWLCSHWRTWLGEANDAATSFAVASRPSAARAAWTLAGKPWKCRSAASNLPITIARKKIDNDDEKKPSLLSQQNYWQIRAEI